jgi:hypothetical protein
MRSHFDVHVLIFKDAWTFCTVYEDVRNVGLVSTQNILQFIMFIANINIFIPGFSCILSVD